MRLLDLFCGAGGAAVGYNRAGFDDIVGVDIEPQPNYPFRFIQADALTYRDALPWVRRFDLVHASPPCQRFSVATTVTDRHPDLIEPTRAMLQAAGIPFVVENVAQAPLRRDLILCGSMFGLDVQRHRAFELSGFPLVLVPSHNHKAWPDGRPWTVTGHGGGSERPHSKNYQSLEHGQELMGMPWAKTRHEIVEAIPPVYTEFIGEQFMAQQR